jgi:hypothetical protein
MPNAGKVEYVIQEQVRTELNVAIKDLGGSIAFATTRGRTFTLFGRGFKMVKLSLCPFVFSSLV